MTDCCLSPRPEGMTAHTVGCLLTTPDPTSHVAALRGLVAPAPKPAARGLAHQEDA